MLQSNPLLTSYDLPPFSAIRTEHLVPAIEEIIADSRINVTAIIASQTPYPTWDDLVLAMDEVKARLDTSLQVIAIIGSVTTQPGWADAAKRCFEQVTAYQAELARNSELFGLYQRLSHSEIAQQFNLPRQKVLQKTLREFRRAGVNLAPEQQQRLLALDNDIERYQDRFNLNVQQAENDWSKHIEDESLLAGIPAPVKRRMANNARKANLQGWLITLSDESFNGVLGHAESRTLRKEVWVAYQARGSAQGPHDQRFNNEEIMTSLLAARHDKAKLLGYDNFAQLALEEQMAKSTDQVSSFLDKELDRHKSLFEREARQLKALALQQDIDELEPWDYPYLAGKTRQQAGASQEQLRAYFPWDSVLSRLCLFAQRLFGVEMLERSDFERWHEDVRLFEIKEFGQAIGYLYIDPFQHDLTGAAPHALGLRNRRMTAEGRPRLPIAVLRSELPPREDDAPCLLDHQHLRIVMHEFGHCLQQLLTGEDYRAVSGLDGLGLDTVEFSSQVLEQWCFSKDFLVWISSHYQTNEPIPTDEAERFLAGIQAQTSWTTANSLLFTLFDFEAHRTFGDGRSALQVFEDVNNKVGHLQWPEAVRPFNNLTGIASSYAARIYSYKWSQVLAEEAFEKFIRQGVFDSDTGRAFREAFFTRGGSRSLVHSLELFLGAPSAGRLSASLDIHDTVLQADTAPDPSIPLVGQLHTSQQQMILLNDTVPRASEVAMQQLRYWLKRTFPSLDATTAVENLSVRTRQEETALSSQSLADGADEPAIKQTKTQTIALEALFWKALAGRIDAGELFLDPGQIDILVTQGNVIQTPANLNSQEAKQQFKTLISNTSVSFEPLLTQALDNFWNRPADFSHSRKVGDWLADEFAAQLRAQADLHRLDATMSQPMHEALTKHALSAPDAASRAELAAKVRPGVYSLNMAVAEGADSVPLPCTVVLTQHDNVSESGTAVLYAPGHPLEIYDNLAALKAGLIKDSLAWAEVSTAPLAQHFLTHLVADVRATQKAIVRDILLEGPAMEEEVAAWAARIDRAADVGTALDLAGVLDEREFQRELKKQNEWLHGNPQVTGHDRREWWKAVRDLYEAQQIEPSPPDPVTLATEDAVSEWTRKRLARLITEKGYVAADPDQVFLSINRYIVDPHAPTGTSPWGAGVSQGTKGIVVNRHSMTQWAMSNLTSEERSVPAPFLEGPMTYDQFKNVIEQADVGARILIELPITAREQQTAWMALKTKQIRAQAWSAHIAGDFRHDKDNTGLNLVLAALDSPTSEGRRKVNTHEVVVRQLKWGDSVLKDILAFGSASLASRPSVTLYSPGAPDNKIFRDLDAGNARELERALAKALTATPEMTQWLISQLPLVEQADQAASLAPTPPDLTLNEKVRKVTQAVFSGAARSRAPADFSSNFSWSEVNSNLLNVLHETQISHAVKTADALTLSNAERDSADAQAGRRNALALLTGAMSMFPASRLGGLLGRAILPVMTGGAAVAAIKSEGGSFDQWLTDFISGLGEVLAEGAEDLIMARAGRHRSKTRPPLSSLPRLQDPTLMPLRLKGFDGTALRFEGRDRYTDASGQGYLKLGMYYYKTAMQQGQRIIYAPDNRTNQRTVTWENGRWKIEAPQRLRGGGPVLSLLGTPEAPNQAKINTLSDAALLMYSGAGWIGYYWYTWGIANRQKAILKSMPEALVDQILQESMDDVGARNIDAYRRHIEDYNSGKLRLKRQIERQKDATHALLSKFNAWQRINKISGVLERNMALPLDPSNKSKLHDVILKHKNTLIRDAAVEAYFDILPNLFTDAKFIIITPPTGALRDAFTRLRSDLQRMTKIADSRAEAHLRTIIQGDGPAAEAARVAYLMDPINRAHYEQRLLDEFSIELTKNNMPRIHSALRAYKIPFVEINKRKANQYTRLVTEEDIGQFQKSIKSANTHNATFEIELLTRAQTNPRGPTADPSSTQPEPEVSASSDRYRVSISPLAELQMTYRDFNQDANLRVTAIMDDIRAGRITTKRGNGYYWYTMSQLEASSGKGRWRAAFERQGDTWTLQGFYDYHTNRTATVWGQ
ncbi:M3 family metallopeptidase [Pseudomonas sp. SWRI154]|uniref:M3 family metallopeptidase n=1 Tax=Pseudomonas sp. SWRI154 TaxID=2745501 RepID=UPI00164438D3|nr:M3 family metallopeptidase [Pseudomonas sp. SWRI154]MBC3364038.1 hypothetical protein [Pseudomonas sp. SWRI154]